MATPDATPSSGSPDTTPTLPSTPAAPWWKQASLWVGERVHQAADWVRERLGGSSAPVSAASEAASEARPVPVADVSRLRQEGKLNTAPLIEHFEAQGFLGDGVLSQDGVETFAVLQKALYASVGARDTAADTALRDARAEFQRLRQDGATVDTLVESGALEKVLLAFYQQQEQAVHAQLGNLLARPHAQAMPDALLGATMQLYQHAQELEDRARELHEQPGAFRELCRAHPAVVLSDAVMSTGELLVAMNVAGNESLSRLAVTAVTTRQYADDLAKIAEGISTLYPQVLLLSYQETPTEYVPQLRAAMSLLKQSGTPLSGVTEMPEDYPHHVNVRALHGLVHASLPHIAQLSTDPTTQAGLLEQTIPVLETCADIAQNLTLGYLERDIAALQPTNAEEAARKQQLEAMATQLATQMDRTLVARSPLAEAEEACAALARLLASDLLVELEGSNPALVERVTRLAQQAGADLQAQPLEPEPLWRTQDTSLSQQRITQYQQQIAAEEKKLKRAA